MLQELPEEKVVQSSLMPWGEPGTLAELITMFSGHEAGHAADLQKMIAEAADRPG
jgi:hypothetical protein